MSILDTVHIALDLETMGGSPDGAITAIGAYTLGPNLDPHCGFYTAVDLRSSAVVGRIDPDTVLWWMKQSDAARQELTKATVDLRGALLGFMDYVHAMRQLGANLLIWGNGSIFDNQILRTAYERLELNCPWTYKEDACLRSLRALYPNVDCPKVGTAHHAGDDAKAQAMWLQKLLPRAVSYPAVRDPFAVCGSL